MNHEKLENNFFFVSFTRFSNSKICPIVPFLKSRIKWLLRYPKGTWDETSDGSYTSHRFRYSLQKFPTTVYDTFKFFQTSGHQYKNMQVMELLNCFIS